MKSLLVDFPRIAGTATRHSPAEVALVRHIGGKPNPVAVVENRREHAHIRGMRTASQIRMINDKGVALLNLSKRVGL